MIRHSFSVFDGIGEKLEGRLWDGGILTWDDFVGADTLPSISRKRSDLIKETILFFSEELQRRNPEPFHTFLRPREHWRLFEIFRSDAACLDIETNGLPPRSGGKVTVVGIGNGNDCRCLVRGEDLTLENLQEELSRYRLLITFFGSSFDIPFLKRVFPGLRVEIPHFDICFGARRVGLKGGLKKLETIMGIERGEEVLGMDGYEAVLLWRQWLKGRRDALDLLLQYNREDTINLLPLAEKVYGLLRESTGIDNYLNGSSAGSRKVEV